MNTLPTLALASLLPFVVACSNPPESAHTKLVKSSPAAGADLPARPSQITLKFNEPLKSSSAISVTSPVGGNVPGDRTQVDGRTATRKLSALASGPGEYFIQYKVNLADGHTATGNLTFTVDPPRQKR